MSRLAAASTMLRPALLLLVATLLACLPAAGLEDWRGTEGRRVQVATEMAERSSQVVPLLGGEPTFAKPPLHYWLLELARAAFGDGYTALRLPSILLVWAAAVLAFALQRRLFGEPAAWLAGLGVICAPLVVMEFPTAEIDPPFACLTAASLWLLAYGVALDRRAAVFAAGAVGGLAMLVKGPVYFLFAAGALLVWWRHRRLRGLLTFALPLLAPSAAYYGVLLGAYVSYEEFAGVAGTETVGRLSAYTWQDVVELPAYLLKAFAVQLPLVLWCFWEWRSRRDARMAPEDLLLRMCSGAAVFAVLLLAVFPARPTRYLLPNVPLFTFAVAPAVAHYAGQWRLLGRVPRAALRALGLMGAAALVAVPWLPAPMPARLPALLVVVALLPLTVRRPRALVAVCLWLPVLGAWTLVADYVERRGVGPRARARYGTVLRAELEAAGVPLDGSAAAAAPAGLSTHGHFDSSLLLGARLLPPGHEAMVRPPTTRFVLHEEFGGGSRIVLDGYRERLRLCMPGETFVLAEQGAR